MPENTSSRRNSILIAAAVSIGLAIWMLSGLGDDVPATESGTTPVREPAVGVAFRQSKASTMQRTITASARTEPDRIVELKAETPGRIVAVNAERGALVRAGEAIVEIDMRDRQARLAETSALIRQRELEFEAAVRLQQQGFMSNAELAAAEALLIAARAAGELIQLDIDRTRIAAPFDAALYERMVEVGDYLAIGDPIAQLVDTDPLIVVGNINEKDIGVLGIGSEGKARVLGGPEVTGTIRYLAPMADESTRSFRVELEIPNPDLRFRVGTSAELILGAEEIRAHVISPGLLTLADDGEIGAMIIDDRNRARFVGIELIGSADAGVITTGLPEVARIITVGQNYVTDGQAVAPIEDEFAPPEPR